MWKPAIQLWLIAICLLVAGSRPPTAAAHPHVWVTYQATLLSQGGTFAGIHYRWSFDEFFTSSATYGLDQNNDGQFDRGELADLTKQYVEGFTEFSYFTFAEMQSDLLEMGAPRDYQMEIENGQLILQFVAPFAEPVRMTSPDLLITVTDPTNFIAFSPVETQPFMIGSGAPGTCRVNTDGPRFSTTYVVTCAGP